MRELELKDLVELNDDLVGDGLILTDNGVDKYIVLKAGTSVNDAFKDEEPMNIKIVTNGAMDISREEFEELKQQLIDALEASVKPIKPEDMN